MMIILFCLLILYVIWPRVVCQERCKHWFIKECKDTMKTRKSVLASFRTNITSENLSKFRIARGRARRGCRENKRAR